MLDEKAAEPASGAAHRQLRICIAYDCLHPWTVGGEERWLRHLAETLAADGHRVTFLTRRQWELDAPPDIPGIEVIAVSPFEPLYGPDGNRRRGEAIRFGIGILRHLIRNRGSYDVLHTCGFPYFHLPAARLALARTGVPIVVDWPEVWSRDYWRSYVGGVGGRIGLAVQQVCIRLTPHALAFSERHGKRLEEQGLRSPALRPGGLGPDSTAEIPKVAVPQTPMIVFAGRHIREKRPRLVVEAAAAARQVIPDLEAVILGDGPERPDVDQAITELAVDHFVSAPGFVPKDELEERVRNATALVQPSSREGFGIVVLEAAAVGTPVVVVDGPDNAAVELVVDGVNGYVAKDATAEAVAEAIVRVHAGGSELRARTAEWYRENAPRLSTARTITAIEAVYRKTASA